MPVTSNPTASRRELGELLRSMRAELGLTAEEVAKRVKVSRSKISRLENGRRGASQADIGKLCELYQVDSALRQALIDLAAEGKQRHWRQTLTVTYHDYMGLEAKALSISDFAIALVPGLLQTPDYARAIVSAFTPAWPAKAVEDRVQGRIERQKLLSSASPPRFTAILDESVLHRIVGGPSVMAGQLRRLLEISEQPSVSIRIVPYDAGTVPAGVNKFIILALPDRTEAVFTEEVTRMRRIDQAEEVKSYKTTWMALADLAASPTFTRDRIRAQLLTYESAQRTA